MKFKFFNKKTITQIIATGFIITTLVNCSEAKAIATVTSNSASISQEYSNHQDTVTYTANDDIMIKKFETIEKDVTTLLEKNDDSIKDKAKGVFITIVDFIFYNGEIDGVTFEQLSQEGKQKILKIANSIDTKINNKFPNYWETISEKTKETFSKARELIQKGANNVNDFAKDKLGEENYQALIDAKDDLVYYTKKAFTIIGTTAKNIWDATSDIRNDIKDKALDILDQGKQKINNWYEGLKNSK